jgi:membrane protease YdiL (CAAX protease family)
MSTRTRQTGATATPPPATTTVRPGWGEIVAGLVLMGIAVYRIPPILGDHAAALGPWYGMALLALPAVAALGGFTTSARARVRSWSAVGVRRASARAVLAGAGAGVAALALTMAVTAVLGAAGVPLGGSRPDTTVVGLLVLGLVTPVAQELLLRGVVTSALLRHGAVVGVLGSAVVSAAAAVLVLTLLPTASVGVVSAAVVGLVAAELLRRTGSVWPGVAAHVVCTTLALTLVVLS